MTVYDSGPKTVASLLVRLCRRSKYWVREFQRRRYGGRRRYKVVVRELEPMIGAVHFKYSHLYLKERCLIRYHTISPSCPYGYAYNLYIRTPSGWHQYLQARTLFRLFPSSQAYSRSKNAGNCPPQVPSHVHDVHDHFSCHLRSIRQHDSPYILSVSQIPRLMLNNNSRLKEFEPTAVNTDPYTKTVGH